MTHPGDGDVPDDGRRKRRRRRRGRRGKNTTAAANREPSADSSPATTNDASVSNLNAGEASGSGTASQPAASGKRKSRSRRRKSGARASGVSGRPSSGSVQSGNAQSGNAQSGNAQSGNAQSRNVQSGNVQSDTLPIGTVQSGTAQPRTGQSRTGQSRNTKAKRRGKARPAGTLRPADANRGADVPAIATAAKNDAVAPRTDAANGGPSDADALAARRARADRETSAGGIVYRVQNGEALFLIIRDSYRNWGFPKGHLEGEELPDEAAIREVQEETGLVELKLDGAIETIDWFFRFRGRLVHKVCHFYLMRTESSRTVPQREEGITACRWARFEDATRLISYANARSVLSRANAMVLAGSGDHSGADVSARSHAHSRAHANTSTDAADAARG